MNQEEKINKLCQHLEWCLEWMHGGVYGWQSKQFNEMVATFEECSGKKRPDLIV